MDIRYDRRLFQVNFKSNSFGDHAEVIKHCTGVLKTKYIANRRCAINSPFMLMLLYSIYKLLSGARIHVNCGPALGNMTSPLRHLVHYFKLLIK